MRADVRVDRGATGVHQPGRRGGPSRAGLLLLIALAVVVGIKIIDVTGPAGTEPATDQSSEDAAAAFDGLAATAMVPQPLLGTAGPVTLHIPAAEALLISFHEAAFPEAIGVVPAGPLIANENSTRFTAPDSQPGGEPYRVQVSRGRANAPTSAVDVALADGQAVLSPVAGVVAEVRPYSLYGRYDDVRLELHPDGATDHAVVLIHVQGIRVKAGDRVAVGTVLADGARRFPFDAVIDRATAPAKVGHVHLEVKRRDG